jgi:hypothetical protein
MICLLDQQKNRVKTIIFYLYVKVPPKRSKDNQCSNTKTAMKYFYTRTFKGLLNQCKVNFINLGLLLIGSLFIVSCGSMSEVGSDRNYSNNRMPNEPGKCYAKSLIPYEYETFEEELVVYTGEDNNAEGVELEKIIFIQATTKWEKVKSPNCRSADPNDCLVWCLKEVPEVSEEYYIVKDTNLVKDFEPEIVSFRDLVKAGGFTEWKEVICEADLSPSLISNIQLALVEKDT